MSRFYSNRFVASLAITVLTVTAGLTPVVAMASEGNTKSTYNVQTTQSLINALTRLGGVTGMTQQLKSQTMGGSQQAQLF